MMTSGQLISRLNILLDKLEEDKTVMDESLKVAVIESCIAFLNMFGYSQVPSDFIKVEFNDRVVSVNFNNNYINESDLIVF